jgi:RNase P protein component
MREAWRALSPSTSGGFDVVFAARPDIRTATFPEVLSDMRGVLAGAGMTAP